MPVIGGGTPTVVGSGKQVVVTPAISTTVYVADYNVGGLMTLTDAMRISSGDGILQGIAITDLANQGPTLGSMDVLIFSSTPPTATFTDHAAFPTLVAADLAVLQGIVRILTSDWMTIGGKAVATKAGIGLHVFASGGDNLYAAVRCNQAPDYASTSDLVFTFDFLRN